MGRTACTELQCLYKGALYLTFISLLVAKFHTHLKDRAFLYCLHSPQTHFRMQFSNRSHTDLPYPYQIKSITHYHTVFAHRLAAKVVENKETLHFLLPTSHPHLRNVMLSHFT